MHYEVVGINNLKSFEIKSFSKINLGLKITGRRNDGFHNIHSIFIENDLHDVIRFEQSDGLEIKFKNQIIPEVNTVSNAINVISDYCNLNKKNIKYKITVIKNIPVGSGLGGGSSNAAYIIKTINKIYDLGLRNYDLEKLAIKIGSDVPFFISGKVKQISGIGEVIKTIDSTFLKDKIFLLVFPDFSISTKWAYSKIKKDLYEDKINTKFPPLDNKVDLSLFENVFEHIVCLTYPEIMDIKSLLIDSGALYASLSGSGSTMFGIYNDIDLAKNAISYLNRYHTCLSLPRI